MHGIFLVLGFAMGVNLCSGINQVKAREQRCTETVQARVQSAKEHHFFGCNYYQLELVYDYNGKPYCTQKGYFKSQFPAEITLHINPENPAEAYLTTIAEKCGHKESGSN